MKNPNRFWDRVANTSANAPGKTASQIVDLTQAVLPANATVLDFACGDGAITQAMCPHASSVLGIDRSEGMVKGARERWSHASENLEFEHLSIYDPAFKGKTFDAITAFNVLHYVKELEALAHRVHQLLNPGGIFVSSTACLGERRSAARAGLWMVTRMGLVPDMIFHTQDSLTDPMLKAGFSWEQDRRITALPELFVVMRKQG